MSYQLAITRPALKSFRKLPAPIQKKIKQVLRQMEESPYDGNVVKIKDSDTFRRRVGNYRILFRVDTGLVAIFIIDIRKRDEKTYRGL